MRGTGKGQTQTVIMIPEVRHLINREVVEAKNVEIIHANSAKAPLAKTLSEVVAFLVLNQLRIQKTQLAMLFIQNFERVSQGSIREHDETCKQGIRSIGSRC